MSIDPFSGRNPSYCFVDLDGNEDADAVIDQLQGCRVRGRPIKVNFNSRKQAEHPRRLETRLRNGERQSFDFTPSKPSSFVFDRFARNDAREHWTKPVEEGKRLYVGGLSDISDQQFVNEEMRQLFEGHNIEAVSKRILPAHRNMATAATGQCYCFVDFPSAVEAEDAMVALNGKPTPYGGAYRIKIAFDQHDRKVCREQAEAKPRGDERLTGEVKRDLSGSWRTRN